MADQSLLLDALRSFAQAMGRSYEITEMCYELCDRSAEALSATGAGVSVAGEEGLLRFVTATSEEIRRLEEVQESTQEGPCVEAFVSRKPVVVPDIRDVEAWPAYKRLAAEFPHRAVVGYPLHHGNRALGAFNVYNAEVREWSEEDLDTLGVFADMATAYLVRTAELAEARQLAGQLQTALDSRVLIEQAKGMLAGERRISVDEAFDLLREHSRENNIRLVDVCQEVVNMGLRISDRP